MDLDEIKIVRLSQEHVLDSFDCGHDDLNEFLLYDSKDYQRGLIAVTYVVKYHDEIIAYFSLSNDKLSVKDSSKSSWRKIKRQFRYSKHREDYPAVKIGRLAVSKKYQDYDIGTKIVDFVKYTFIDNNRTGCAFITVDALRGSVNFYLKNKFKHLLQTTIEPDSKTVPLYYNLLELV